MLYPPPTENTFFWSVHGTLSKEMGHRLGYKIRLNKYTDIKIVQNTFSTLKEVKREINNIINMQNSQICENWTTDS